MINNNNLETDEIVETKLNEGLSQMEQDYEIMSSQKVGPTIADDIKNAAMGSIVFSLLIIFIYPIKIQKMAIQFGCCCSGFS